MRLKGSVVCLLYPIVMEWYKAHQFCGPSFWPYRNGSRKTSDQGWYGGIDTNIMQNIYIWLVCKPNTMVILWQYFDTMTWGFWYSGRMAEIFVQTSVQTLTPDVPHTIHSSSCYRNQWLLRLGMMMRMHQVSCHPIMAILMRPDIGAVTIRQNMWLSSLSERHGWL